ncbi:MAG: sulfurtransferase [Flavobacteriaceae bacterium]|nr:sulfurtransferase [Flavobacteriaceae bacterium]
MDVVLDTPLVSTNWLMKHINATNLVILNTSMKAKEVKGETLLQYIPNSQYFDIKYKFSAMEAPFPNTIPSAAQFAIEAQKLGIHKNTAIVVYDDKGIYSCARAYWLFKAFGHDNVAVLDGGLPQWLIENKPVINTYIKTLETGNFESEYNSSYFKHFEDIQSLINIETCLILDARSKARFNGTEKELRIGLRSGNIPNSKSLPYTNLFDGYTLKSRAEINEIFNNLIVEQEQLVFTCGSGITACILALCALHVNYKNLSVYDGSWTEYGSLT